MLTLILTLMINILAFYSLNYHSLVYLMVFTFFLSLTNFGSPFITLWFQSTNINFSMISLTIFVSTLMMMVGKHYSSIYAPQAITTLMSICILFFSTNNFILLYITFELSLIPTLMMIIKWGYQPERLQASYYLMMYTISASLPLMMMLVYMYMNNFSLYMNPQSPLCMYMNMQHMNYFISIMFILAFLVKLPVYGAHLWLPKAHVEAPISGSMILAGILLKLGGYGLMKMVYILTNLSNMMYMVFSVSIWGALIVSFVCMTSIDMKKLIAYSSVIHMNLLIIGMISMSDIGTKGAVLMMISHGISSPGMFTMAHLNYQKALSRNLLLQKGFSQIQPVFMLTWFFLISANMAAPPSLNLASEIFISISILKISFFFSLLLAIITFMSASYNLYIFSAQLSNVNYLNPFKKSTSLEFLGALTQSLPCYFLILLLPIWS